MPSSMFLHGFADNVRSRPGSIALSWGDDEFMSYRELDELARTAADSLAAAGLTRRPRLCVVGSKSPAVIAVLIAAWRTGLTVLLPSHALGESRISELAARAGIQHIVRLPGATDSVSFTVTTLAEPAQLPVASNSLLMLTTSGSTGVPKIVPLSAPGSDRFIQWAARTFKIGSYSRVLSYAPLNFDLSLLDVWTSLAVGARAVLVDENSATNPKRLADLLDGHRVTVAQAVPMFYRLLSEQQRRFETVRQVVVTGDAISGPVLTKLPRVFPNASFFNVYGCTETNDSLLHELRSFGEHEQVPIGRPLADVRIRIVQEDGTVLSGAGTGELWVSTPFQADRYLDPELTKERFIADLDGHVYYRTGDIVHRNATGVLSLIGRDDFHVKVRGVRTNMAEVEQVLQSRPDVLEAAVLAKPDETAGNVLHAVVRRRADSALNSLKLRSECARLLPRTAIPAKFIFVSEPLPRTSTGKIDRNKIPI